MYTDNLITYRKAKMTSLPGTVIKNNFFNVAYKLFWKVRISSNIPFLAGVLFSIFALFEHRYKILLQPPSSYGAGFH